MTKLTENEIELYAILSDYELAFYDAVANNETAKEVLGNDILRDLAIYLVETVRKNASIDWTIRTNARAKLKMKVKRALRKFGYPPESAETCDGDGVEAGRIVGEGAGVINSNCDFD